MGKAGDTAAGGSAQELLPREGLTCRLQVMGWHGLSSPLFPEVPEAGGARDDQHRSRKPLVGSLRGVRPALGPPWRAARASCISCCCTALQAGAELCLGRVGWGEKNLVGIGF